MNLAAASTFAKWVALVLVAALPAAWPTGRVTGLRARGGFEVDLAWQAGALTEARLRSPLGRPFVGRCGDREVRFETHPGRVYDLAAQLRE